MDIYVHQGMYLNNKVKAYSHEFIFIVLVVNVLLFFLFHLIEAPRNITRSEKVVRPQMSGESDKIMNFGFSN